MRRRNGGGQSGREASVVDRLKQGKAEPQLVESQPLLPVSPNTQKLILFFGLCLFWTCALLGAHRYLYGKVSGPVNEVVAAAGNILVNDSFVNIPCSKDYAKETFHGCLPSFCGRFVSDSVVTEEEAAQLQNIARKGLSLGGSNGGASILDLHSGALSKGDSFIDVFQAMRSSGRTLITAEDFRVYIRVKNKVHEAIAEAFQVDKHKLFLTKPTFFSRITTKTASTLHDEYWHPHVDKTTYGSFHYTALVYLSTKGVDFDGGDFVFIDAKKEAGVESTATVNRTVEPRMARVSSFTSGNENLHHVAKVTRGTRYAVTIAFTCDPKQAIGDPTAR